MNRVLRRVLGGAVLSLVGACGSTEPALGPATAPVAGSYALAGRSLVNPNGAFIPDTATYTIYTSDTFTLSDGGQWTRTYSGERRRGATATPISGTMAGTYLRSGTTITFVQGATIVTSAQFTGAGMTRQETYYVYAYDRR